MKNVVAIVVAAGKGQRMGAGKNKVLLSMGDGTILEKTLRVFEKASSIDGVIVVVSKNELNEVGALLKTLGMKKIKAVVPGGGSRQESVFAGLMATENSDRWVLVHDGARPMISSKNIDEFVDTLFEKKALVMAIPVVDTIKKVENGIVTSTLERKKLWRAQTPQGFLKEELLGAHKKALNEGYETTDDSALMEWIKKEVHVYEGQVDNIKITKPKDLLWACWQTKQKE